LQTRLALQRINELLHTPQQKGPPKQGGPRKSQSNDTCDIQAAAGAKGHGQTVDAVTLASGCGTVVKKTHAPDARHNIRSGPRVRPRCKEPLSDVSTASFSGVQRKTAASRCHF